MDYLKSLEINIDNLQLEYNLDIDYTVNEETKDVDFSYEAVAKKYGIKNGDIVWIKFTKEGYVGVVASGNDINFQIPNDLDVIDEREKGKWKYNTSGILVKFVNQSWDEGKVIVIPVDVEKCGYTKRQIEMGIGNYLIDNDVPIIDYYSHNYGKLK